MQSMNIQDIIIDNKYLRCHTDVTKLEKSIQTLGLIAPLIINEENRLIAGGRRYRALKNLNMSEVPVIIVKKNELEEELISIDENLVRLDLDKVELESNLNRAKELYKEMAKSSQNISDKLLSEQEEIESKINEEKKLQEELESDESSVSKLAHQKFMLDVSEKTGMSPRQVWQAMERDDKSSDQVKDQRSKGNLNIGQTNELIKLKKEDQEKLLPHIKDKTVKEIRNIVSEVRKNGIDDGVEKSQDEQPHAKELLKLSTNIKKVYKLAKKLELEGIALTGGQEKDILKNYLLVKESMEKILSIDESSTYSPYMNNSNNEVLLENSL